MGSRGMMTKLLSVIFLLLASTLAQEDDCPANDNSPSCDDPAEQTICQLTCNRASGACAQYDEAKCGQIGVDVTNEAYPDMFATRCKAICEESRDSESAQDVCRFYKVSDFLCDNGPTLNDAGDHLEIVAPNTCVLLCDFHLSMSLDCQISEEGETKCYDEGDPNPTSADNIYCWTPPSPGPGPTAEPTPPPTTAEP